MDPETGKPIRAARVPLTDADKTAVVNERIKLGAVLSNDNLPDSIRREAEKLLGLGTTQLLRRIQKGGR